MLLIVVCVYALAAVVFYGWLRGSAADAPDAEHPALLVVQGGDSGEVRRVG